MEVSQPLPTLDRVKNPAIMLPHSSLACLEIPIPKSIKDVVTAPPNFLPTSGDHESLELLKKLGEDFGRPTDEIAQTLNLAAGFSDIVIILERPSRTNKFNVSFEEFVKSCATLLAVDELIRFASKGARSIHTVTILDAFSYQPDKNAKERDKRCHEVLAQILRLKKPKVILRCHRDEYCGRWLKRIELPGKDYQLERKEIAVVEEHTTVILQSFHPSCAVNNANCRPEYRALLIYHFVAAFSELRSECILPETAERVRKLCLIKGERRSQDIPVYEPWQAARSISEVLETTYKGPSEAHFVEFADETMFERRSTQIEAFDALTGSLRQLFGSKKTVGGLAIAKIVLFLWKQHFQRDPLYDLIMSWLILRGNEENDWFPCDNEITSDQSTLEDQLSCLQISTPPTISDARLMEDEVAPLLVQVAATFVRGENLAEDLHTRIIGAFDKHNGLVRRYLRESSMCDINHAMRVRTLLIRCETALSAIRVQSHTLGRDILHDAIRCLKDLASLLDAEWQK